MLLCESTFEREAFNQSFFFSLNKTIWMCLVIHPKHKWWQIVWFYSIAKDCSGLKLLHLLGIIKQQVFHSQIYSVPQSDNIIRERTDNERGKTWHVPSNATTLKYPCLVMVYMENWWLSWTWATYICGLWSRSIYPGALFSVLTIRVSVLWLCALLKRCGGMG